MLGKRALRRQITYGHKLEKQLQALIVLMVFLMVQVTPLVVYMHHQQIVYHCLVQLN